MAITLKESEIMINNACPNTQLIHDNLSATHFNTISFDKGNAVDFSVLL